MKKVMEGLVVFSLIPVMFILAILEWVESVIFGEYDDYEY